VLEKVRTGDREVAISKIPHRKLLEGHTPVLIDDIISSARTMIQTLRQGIASRGCAPICIGVHGIFAERAYQALLDAGALRVVTTNSIPHRSNDIDLTSILIDPVQDWIMSSTK
jgi:ribose-phosphate pyrophosphokinase